MYGNIWNIHCWAEVYIWNGISNLLHWNAFHVIISVKEFSCIQLALSLCFHNAFCVIYPNNQPVEHNID